MNSIYTKPCAVLIAGIIMAEASLFTYEDPHHIKETDVPSENTPYQPPPYTLGAIVATTSSTTAFATIL